MKKQLICLLTICLLLTCLTACGQQKVTVTQTNTPPVTEDVVFVEQQIGSEKNEPVESVQAQVTTDEKTEENAKADNDDLNPSAVAKPNKTTNTEGLTQEETHALLAYDEPTFTTFDAYNRWLTHGGARDDERSKLLADSNSSFHKGFYYKPKETGNTVVSLIEVQQKIDATVYVYLFEGQEDWERSLKIKVPIAITDTYIEHSYEWLKKNENFKYTSAKCNGMEYFIFHLEKEAAPDYTSIFWYQDNNLYAATLHDHYDQLNEILPLLQVEKVSFKANDHVTQ